MVTIYSMECFLYKSLNHASRFADETKFNSLGPYAQCMDFIVRNAINSRKDELDGELFLDLDLFRGTSLTKA
jgi:hypothetical protein